MSCIIKYMIYIYYWALIDIVGDKKFGKREQSPTKKSPRCIVEWWTRDLRWPVTEYWAIPRLRKMAHGPIIFGDIVLGKHRAQQTSVQKNEEEKNAHCEGGYDREKLSSDGCPDNFIGSVGTDEKRWAKKMRVAGGKADKEKTPQLKIYANEATSSNKCPVTPGEGGRGPPEVKGALRGDGML